MQKCSSQESLLLAKVLSNCCSCWCIYKLQSCMQSPKSSFWGLVLPFHHVGPRDWTRISRHGGKCLQWPNHLPVSHCKLLIILPLSTSKYRDSPGAISVSSENVFPLMNNSHLPGSARVQMCSRNSRDLPHWQWIPNWLILLFVIYHQWRHSIFFLSSSLPPLTTQSYNWSLVA